LIKGVALKVKSLFIIGAGSNHPHALSKSTFPKPAIVREGDTKKQKQKTDMKKLIMKLLGLNTLVTELNTLKNEVLVLADENKELKTKIENLENVVEEIEIPDMDDYVASCDLDDNIESYLNNNDYASRDWVTDEINDQIDTDRIVEECVEKLEDDIEEKIRDLFNDASPAPMGVDDIKKEVSEAVKVTLEKMVKALADQQK
jgi:hypothetical protein